MVYRMMRLLLRDMRNNAIKAVSDFFICYFVVRAFEVSARSRSQFACPPCFVFFWLLLLLLLLVYLCIYVLTGRNHPEKIEQEN